MNRRVIITVLLAFVCLSVGAQSAKSLINEFRNVKGAEYVHIPRMLLSLAKPFASRGGDEAAAAVKSIRSMRVLEIENCPDKTRRNIMERASKLSGNGYHEILRSNDHGGQTVIMVLGSKDILRELLIVNCDKDESDIVLITGKFKAKDAARLIRKNRK